MKEYITVSGDTWDLISHKAYGSSSYVGELLKANPDYITTVQFQGGIKIFLPEIANTISNSLPPWKRGIV